MNHSDVVFLYKAPSSELAPVWLEYTMLCELLACACSSVSDGA